MTKPPIPFLPPCERCGAAAGEPSHASTTWDVCPVCLRTNRNTPPIDDTADPIALLMEQVHAGGKLSMLARDKQLRQALDFAIAHTMDGTAMCAIFGALGSMVESSEDAEALQALQLVQQGILQLLGGFEPGSKLLTTTVLQVQTIDNDGGTTNG